MVSPLPPLQMSMLRMRSVVLTSFMANDHTSLINIDDLPPPMNPDVSCVTYTTKIKTQIIPANIAPCCCTHYCFKCLGPHPKVDRQNIIPFTLNNCATCHMIHNGPTLDNVPLQEEKDDLTIKINFKVNITMFLFGLFGEIIVYT